MTRPQDLTVEDIQTFHRSVAGFDLADWQLDYIQRALDPKRPNHLIRAAPRMAGRGHVRRFIERLEAEYGDTE